MLVFSGFLTGLIVGLTGVGGGALMTPILLIFFGIAPTTAIGTDLFFAAITKIIAGGVHHAKGLVDWQVLKRMWLGSLPASIITILFLNYSKSSFNSDYLRDAVAYLVLLTAVGIIFQQFLQRLGRNFRIADQEQFKYIQPPLTVLAGAILGVVVTLTSVGAGALGAVFLTYLYPLRLHPARLVATDIVHAIPLALFAGVGHLFIGHIDFILLGTLLLGSLPGAYIGARLSSFLPSQIVKYALALVLVCVSIKLLLL